MSLHVLDPILNVVDTLAHALAMASSDGSIGSSSRSIEPHQHWLSHTFPYGGLGIASATLQNDDVDVFVYHAFSIGVTRPAFIADS